MKKCTFQASSDIALVKYWGKKDAENRLPENGSISMVLDGLNSVTTVEFVQNLEADMISIDGSEISQDSREAKRVIAHLDRIRALAGSTLRAKVVSQNNFPRGTGLSSSSSGFAALTLAALGALEIDLPAKEVSILARQASGSACRVVNGGFVEWHEGDSSETSFSETISGAEDWDLRDIIAVVDSGQKTTSSTSGHELAQTSPFFSIRQKNINQKLTQCRKFIQDKDFSALGALAEAEALEFHSIILTSTPPLIFWKPGTVAVMHEVQQLREEGIECYFTLNTGFNVHILTTPENEEIVTERIGKLELVKSTINARSGGSPVELTEHLF